MSTTTVISTCGFNGYGQVNTHKDSRIINRFIDLYQCPDGVILSSTWSRHFIGEGNKLKILTGASQGPNVIQFESEIKSIAANEEICLALLACGHLWKVDLQRSIETKLNFLSTEGAEEDQQPEIPLFISATLRGFFTITNRNRVYSIPTQIGQLPSGKVLKLVSGYEHCLALLANGDVFVWGGGLKGQLGLGELSDIEQPVLLVALAGIRIVEIAAGGWHSCAISEIGDLYIWGWNKNGQLGIPIKLKQTIYALPELVDIETEAGDQEEIDLVACGSSHTLIFTKSKKLFGSGWTEFGQLSELQEPSGFADKFTLIPSSPAIIRLVCGPWTSSVVLQKPKKIEQ